MAFAGWGIFMRGGNIFKTMAVSVTRICLEGNVLGWDSTGTKPSDLRANLMSKTDVRSVSNGFELGPAVEFGHNSKVVLKCKRIVRVYDYTMKC